MGNMSAKIRIAKSFFTGEYCLKTDDGKRITRWFKTYVEDVAGDFVLLETNRGTFLYHKDKAELLYEDYRKDDDTYIYKLTDKLYYLEVNATDHGPFIWIYRANGEKVEMPLLEEVCVIKGNLICAREYGGKYGIMDDKLNWKTYPRYSDMYDHIEGICAGIKCETNSTDLISFNEDGTVNIVNISGYIGEALTKELVVVSLNGKHGVYSIKGQKILDIIYEDVCLKGNHFILKQDNMYGLADITGKMICDCKYYRIRKTESGFKLITRQIIEKEEDILV